MSLNDKKMISEIKNRLKKLDAVFKTHYDLIGNRATAVSVFLFASKLIGEGNEKELNEFMNFFIKFSAILKNQVKKGIEIDKEYKDYYLKFQTFITQAADEKYAIENREAFLGESFYFYKEHGELIGDKEYHERMKKGQTI